MIQTAGVAPNQSKIAFDLSEKFSIPSLLRTTTRVNHGRGVVTLGKIVEGKKRGRFNKDSIRFRNFPPYIMETHEELHKKLDELRKISEEIDINFSLNEGSRNNLGIVTSGVAFNYVMDTLQDLKLNLSVLKLGMTYPIPDDKIRNFIKNLELAHNETIVFFMT